MHFTLALSLDMRYRYRFWTTFSKMFWPLFFIGIIIEHTHCLWNPVLGISSLSTRSAVAFFSDSFCCECRFSMHFDHVFWSRISITWRDHMISIVDLLFDSTSTLFGKYTDVEVLMIMNTRDCKTSGGSPARSPSLDSVSMRLIWFIVLT